jgi:hypothetical protein
LGMKVVRSTDDLSQHSRIRRSGERPSFVRDESAKRRAYPFSLNFSWKAQSVGLKYRISRQTWLMEEKDEIGRRELFCWISHGQRRVSAIQLFEYDICPGMSDGRFFDLMDAESLIEGHLAETLCDSWKRFSVDVAQHGTLLDFRMAWADTALCPHGLWSAVAKEIISREFPGHVLLTMKAFPLEYEGSAPIGAPSHAGLLSRQKAMIRYYRQQFGVTPFSGQSGEEGWLYRINEGDRDAVMLPSSGLSDL